MNQITNFRSPNYSAKRNPNAVALARVSTEDQFIKGLSVPEQRERIEKWAKANNVNIIRFVEIPHSAYRGLDEEPQVMELLEQAKTDPRISYFLVDEKSRLARRKYLRVVWSEELRRNGVQVVGVSEPQYDRNTIHGIWMEGISETKDEARSIETAYHTTKGMMRNAVTRDPESGYCFKNGGMPPDGYVNKRVIRGKDSRGKDIIKLLWEINNERAKIIRYIVLELWKERRLSYTNIRDHLNSEEPKFDGSIAPILNSKGLPWGKTTIRETCMKALEGAYSGIYYWNRTGRDLRGTGQKWKDANEWVTVENAHPPIISLDELALLKEKMEPIVMKNKKRKRTNTKAEESQYLFSFENSIGEHMFVCLNCGGPINGSQAAKYYYYLCANYKNKGVAGCAKGIYLPKDEVEKKVITALKNRFSRDRILEIVTETNKLLKEYESDEAKAEQHIKKTILNIENSIKGIMNAIQQAGDSSAVPLLIQQLEKLQAEKETAELDLLDIKKQPTSKAAIPTKLNEEDIINKVESLDVILSDPTVANKDKKMAIRYFIRQLQYDPDSGELYVYFWPNPAEEKEKIVFSKTPLPTKKDGEQSSPSNLKYSDNVISRDGAGDRNRTGTIML